MSKNTCIRSIAVFVVTLVIGIAVVSLIDGWASSSALAIKSGLVVFISLLISSLVYSFLRVPTVLNKEVETRTQRLTDANKELKNEIAERQCTEEALLETEQRFRSLFQATFEGILIHDRGIILDANEAASVMMGYEVPEVIGRSVLDLVTEESKQRLKDVLAVLAEEPYATGNAFEVVARRKDGTTFDVEILGKPFTWKGRPVRVVAMRDITERKQAETALRYRVELETFITTISTNFIHLDLDEIDRGIHTALQKVGEFAGADRCYIIHFSGDTWSMTHEWCSEGIASIKDSQQNIPLESFSWWLEALNRFEFLQITSVADLPEEARAEREFIQSAGIKSVMAVPMAYGKSLQGFLGFNAVRSEQIWPDDTITILNIVGDIFVNSFARKHAQEALQQVNEGLELKVEERTRELREKQGLLVQSEKMAALGQLVAGIAHEINTPLGALNSNNDTFIRTVNKMRGILTDESMPSDVREHGQLQRIFKSLDQLNQVNRDAAGRIMSIVSSLRKFARLDQAEVDEVNLHEGLDSTLILVHHEIKNRIEVRKDYGKIPLVSCHPNQINQVFMNILVNASQAIDGKGTVDIKTYQRDNDTVTIEITDSGKGIDQAHLSRVFDPGFTTKGSGIGTGLGLSIVHRIIKDHNGEIEVESEIGKGSTFRIILPIK